MSTNLETSIPKKGILSTYYTYDLYYPQILNLSLLL